MFDRSPAGRLLLVIVLCVCGVGVGCDRIAETVSDEQKDPHFLIGKSRASSLDYEGAVEAFERALENNPRSAAAHFELGLLYYQKVLDPAAAIFHFQKYLRLRQDAPHRENVQQFVLDCKQEIAKTVSLGPVNQKVQRDLEQLAAENLRLKQQVETLVTTLTVLSNRPPAAASVAGGPARPAAGVGSAAAATAPRPASIGSGPSNTTKAAPSGGRVHRVKAGETPTSIAKRYGVKVSALLAANPGLEPARLRTGQTITIPSR
jgi:tetratricopeptide (TPR) repeat protein